RRSDETISTLRDAMAHHCETAMSTILTAAGNRETLLRDFLAYRRDALRPGPSGTMRTVVFPRGSDPARLSELSALLIRSGVEVREAGAGFRIDKAHSYFAPQPAGS